MQYLRILDTTLRDGDQTAGFAFLPEQKEKLALLLDACGVDCIEAGFPCSSAEEYSVCARIARADLRADVAVMSRCVDEDIVKSAGVFSEITNKKRAVIHLTIPVSSIQIQSKLHKSADEILSLIRESVATACGLVHTVEIGFEDATRADRLFLASCCRSAVSSGASVVNIADTTGSFLPEETADLIQYLMREVPSFADKSVVLSIHCHNDSGLALSCTLAAVRAGALQAEVTAAGLGERCGNTPLEELLYVLSAHEDVFGISTGLRKERFAPLYRALFSCCGTDFSPLKPVTGWNSDSHASGIHQQGIVSDPRSYIANPAESYGMVHRRFVLSRHSGKNGLLAVVRTLTGGTVDLSPDETEGLLAEMKAFPESEVGATVLYTMLCERARIRYKPLILQIMKVVYENGAYRVRISGQNHTAEGSADTLESALVQAVNRLSSVQIGLGAVSVTRYAAEGAGVSKTRVYAELFTGSEKKLHPVSSCKAGEADALLCCMLDVVNSERFLSGVL
jgi:2-isopropylmalate synthase